MASVALYALLCVIWGSTWLVIKIGYGGLGPFTVAALRFLLAGGLLTIIVPALGARWPPEGGVPRVCEFFRRYGVEPAWRRN